MIKILFLCLVFLQLVKTFQYNLVINNKDTALSAAVTMCTYLKQPFIGVRSTTAQTLLNIYAVNKNDHEVYVKIVFLELVITKHFQYIVIQLSLKVKIYITNLGTIIVHQKTLNNYYLKYNPTAFSQSSDIYSIDQVDFELDHTTSNLQITFQLTITLFVGITNFKLIPKHSPQFSQSCIGIWKTFTYIDDLFIQCALQFTNLA